MTTADIDTSGEVWIYTPRRHKTSHHGHERKIYLGPKAIAVLKPWLRINLQERLVKPWLGNRPNELPNVRHPLAAAIDLERIERAILSGRRATATPATATPTRSGEDA